MEHSTIHPLLNGPQEARTALEGAPAGDQVYVVKNATGDVIYVGIVGTEKTVRSGITRLTEHLRTKPGELSATHRA